jgi:uncharacterized protein YggE
MRFRLPFLGSALLTLVAASPVLAAPLAQAGQQTGISVVGEGRVTVSPDVARVIFGVETTNPSLSQAMSEASASMNRVLDRLVELGVSRDDIQTVNFSVSPVYEGRGEGQVLRGYRVSNAASATPRDFSQIGTIIDEVVAAGATRVQSLSFDSSRRAQLHDQAREEAMRNARAKATQLASLAGVSLGPVISIQESDLGVPAPVRAAPMAAAAEATPIEGGQLEIRTTVQVTWGIQ